jgi:RNA polymerase sigma-70 factor (ECF subfamily)
MTAPTEDDARLVAALRAGDESAFAELLDRYHVSLVRLATTFVGSRATAEDVAQETWIGVIRGIAQFEGRSSLKTWIFRILTNRAKTRAEREGRVVPFSALDDDPAVEPSRFVPEGTAAAQSWLTPPRSWEGLPENRLLAAETRERIRAAIDALPPAQRTVIQLRDVDGWGSADVCNVLGISESNQRVLLHRARSKVRRALERYLDDR